jgi:hypothetical protein
MTRFLVKPKVLTIFFSHFQSGLRVGGPFSMSVSLERSCCVSICFGGLLPWGYVIYKELVIIFCISRVWEAQDQEAESAKDLLPSYIMDMSKEAEREGERENQEQCPVNSHENQPTFGRCGGTHLWFQPSGKWRQKDYGTKPVWAKSTRPHLKNKLKAKGLAAWLKWHEFAFVLCT